MKKLQAVRMLDRGVGCSVVGYVNRGKNRKAVWVFEHPNHNPFEIGERIAQAEDQRKRDNAAGGAVPGIKGDTDDR